MPCIAARLDRIANGLPPLKYAYAMLNALHPSTRAHAPILLSSVFTHINTYASAHNWSMGTSERVMLKVLDNGLTLSVNAGLSDLEAFPSPSEKCFVAWTESIHQHCCTVGDLERDSLFQIGQWVMQRKDLLPRIPTVYQDMYAYVCAVQDLSQKALDHLEKSSKSREVLDHQLRKSYPTKSNDFANRMFLWGHLDLMALAQGMAWELKTPRIDALLDRNNRHTCLRHFDLRLSNLSWFDDRMSAIHNATHGSSLNNMVSTIAPSSWYFVRPLATKNARLFEKHLCTHLLKSHSENDAFAIYKLALSTAIRYTFSQDPSYENDDDVDSMQRLLQLTPLLAIMPLQEKHMLLREWFDCIVRHTIPYNPLIIWFDRLHTAQELLGPARPLFETTVMWLKQWDVPVVKDLDLLVYMDYNLEQLLTWLNNQVFNPSPVIEPLHTEPNLFL